MSPRPSRGPFEQLVRDHHADVYRSAYRVLKDADDAMDVTQQVFLKLFEQRRAPTAWRDVGGMLRWLAVRTAFMHLRSAKARRRRERSQAMKNPENDAGSRLEKEEEASALRRFLNLLPDELRIALVLRFQEGLKYAEIAQATDCAEPTAHQRVRRGLERIRGRLRDVGFSALALKLEDGLSAPEPVSVPAGLSSKLLALSSPTTAGAPLLLAGLLGAVLLGVVGWRWLGGGLPAGDPARPGAPQPRAVTGAADDKIQESPRREEVRPKEAAGAAVMEAATLRGRVLDRDGRPAGGLTVKALSVERDGKFATIQEETTTGADGAFGLELPVTLSDFQEFNILVEYDGGLILVHNGLRLRPGQVLEQELVLATELDERDGEFTLEVVLRDRDGNAIPGALVIVQRSLATLGEFRWQKFETSGRTDPSGRVRLSGGKLGRKRLDLVTGRPGRSVKSVDLELEKAGLTEKTITMNNPHSITGVAGAADETLPAGISLKARSSGGGGGRFNGVVEADGRFQFHNLPLDAYDLEAGAPGYEATLVGQIESGTDGVTLVLRREGEKSALEQRTREIHGRMLDGRTGEPLKQVFPDVEVLTLPDVSAEELALDFLPNHLFETPAQVMMPDEFPPATDEFHMEGMEAARYMVRGQFAGRAPCFSPILDLREAQAANDVLLRFQPAAYVEGTVLGSAGEPLRDAFVVVTGYGPISDTTLADIDEEVRRTAGRGYHYFTHWKTDENGHFGAERIGLPADLPLRLAILHPEHEPVRTGVLRLMPGEMTSGVEIRLRVRRER
ncbi:MAG: sigma-70 family RNA polymerase sigma factor [Planctomycetota bacterium]